MAGGGDSGEQGPAGGGQIWTTTRTIDGNYSQSFTYDLVGRVKTLTYPDGSLAEHAYTDGGEHSKGKLNGVVMGTWSSFNALGKPGRVDYSNSVYTTYGYDVMSHLTSLTTMKGALELQKLTYDWYTRPNTGGLNIGSITDGRGNKIAADGSNTDETQSFTYDALYRLTQAAGVWGYVGGRCGP